jgi:hypothetical protein
MEFFTSVGEWYLTLTFLGQVVSVIVFFGLFMLFCIGFSDGIDQANGTDNRTDAERLMKTHIGDGVTTVGSALDAVNAKARGRAPKSAF